MIAAKGKAMATNPRAIARKSGTRRSFARPASKNPDAEQDREISRLREDLAVVSKTVMQLAGMGAVENVISNGFNALIEEIAPLRSLAVDRTLMTPEQLVRLRKLTAAGASPEWAGATSLSVRENAVPFIGAVAAAPEPSAPSPLLPPIRPPVVSYA
jgi:hypothetical protein